MSGWNLMKAADRARARQEFEAELKSCQSGTWPRNLNDRMRWGNLPQCPYDLPEVARQKQQEYVTRMCLSGLVSLADLERRIAEGDPEVSGYEKIDTVKLIAPRPAL